MRARKPDEAPGPGHDPVHVVPAPTGRQPATPGMAMRNEVDQSRRLAHRGRGHTQVRERVPRVRIGAVLGDDQVRPERGGQLGEQRTDRRQPRLLAGSGLHRHVDRGAGRDAFAQLPHPAAAREQVPTGLVERHRQHAWIRPVDGLDPIPVVHVEIDVQDAQPFPSGPRDRQRGVVVDAEAGRAIGHRMVQPAAWMEGVLDVAAEDGLDRSQRPAGDRRARLVHPGEWRIVASLADPGLGPPERIGREPLDDRDVASGMGPQELVV